MVLRLFGLRGDIRVGTGHSEEELKMILAASFEEGVLEAEETEMPSNVFEFADTEAREVMVPRPDVVGLPATATVAEAAVLVEQQYQEMEVWYPVYRLREAGCAVELVGPEAGKTYASKLGYPAKATLAAPHANVVLDGPVSLVGTATTYNADDRTNQLVLITDARQHAFFDELITKLDVIKELQDEIFNLILTLQITN